MCEHSINARSALLSFSLEGMPLYQFLFLIQMDDANLARVFKSCTQLRKVFLSNCKGIETSALCSLFSKTNHHIKGAKEVKKFLVRKTQKGYSFCTPIKWCIVMFKG